MVYLYIIKKWDMGNFHRIQWIDGAIKEKRYPCIKTISERFEISDRQVYRDIEYMKYSLGAPIEYSAKEKGYLYTDSTFTLPSFFISEEEKAALKFLSVQYSKIKEESSQNLARLFSRLSGQDDENISQISIPFYQFSVGNAKNFSTVQSAISQDKKLDMSYVNYQGIFQQRTVSPYKIFKNGDRYYFVGYCHLKQDLRVFRLDRAGSMAVREEKRYKCPYYDPEKYVDDMTYFEYIRPYKCTIEFCEEMDEQNIKFKVTSKNGKRYGIEFFSSYDLLGWLFTASSKFKIIEPVWLKEKLKQKIKKIYSMNEGEPL